MSDSPKSIFEYDSYRTFLKDHYKVSKAENKKFSFGFLAKALGYSSPIFVKRILDGDRNLTLDGIERFSRALKFNKEEAAFFKNLVLFNQAKNEDEKKVHAENIFKSRTYRKLLPLSEAQFQYYSSWYLVPIRELIALPNFKEDYTWIASRIHPSITPAQAKKAVEELLKLRLITRDEQGYLKQTTIGLTSPDNILSPFRAQWMAEIIKLGADSIKQVPREKRDLSSVTLGMSAQSLEKIKEIIKQCRKDIMEVAGRDRDAHEQVYQLNIQIFPLTQSLETKEDK